MTFTQRLQDSLDKGLKASKDLLIKARDTAKDLGDSGILKIEINHLENQAEKVMGQLGSFVFEYFNEKAGTSLAPDSEELKKFLDEIEDLKAKIEEKETELKNIREKK